MTSYNRVRGISWPVTFTIEGGRRFTVSTPERSPDGVDLVMSVRVEGGTRAGDYVLGPTGYPPSTGGVVGRTLRWWWETTHVSVPLAKAPQWSLVAGSGL